MANIAETGREPADPTEPRIRIQSFEERYQKSALECIVEIMIEQSDNPNVKPRPRYEKIHDNCQRFYICTIT